MTPMADSQLVCLLSSYVNSKSFDLKDDTHFNMRASVTGSPLGGNELLDC